MTKRQLVILLFAIGSIVTLTILGYMISPLWHLGVLGVLAVCAGAHQISIRRKMNGR